MIFSQARAWPAGEDEISTPVTETPEPLEEKALTSPGATGGKVLVKSYGCQMNVYDATRMADVLAPEGYEETTNIAEADLVVLNTCHIRERAADKVFSELGKVRVLKEERAERGLDMKIAVAG